MNMRRLLTSGGRLCACVALVLGAVTPTAAQVAYTVRNLAGVASVDGTGAAASFALPFDIAAAPDGTLVVSDFYGGSIRRVTPAGVTTTVAIVGGTTTVRGVAVASDGTIYATHEHSIYRIAPDGTGAVFAGQPGTAGSSDGVRDAARFRSPQDVAVDALGRVYVSDGGNGTIRRITTDGTVTTVAGTPGAFGTADGTGAVARFGDLTSLAMDPQGRLVIADVTLRRMTSDGVVTTIPIAGGGGHRATFVTVGTDGTIYTTPYLAPDTSQGIYAVSTAGVVTNITPSHPQPILPTGITVGPSGDLFLVEANTRSVKRVTSTALIEVAGRGPGCFITIQLDGPGEAARFCKPSGIAVAPDGTVFVADTGNATVRRITPGGVVTTFAGATRQTGSSDAVGVDARFAGGTLGLRGIVLDSLGNLFVADLGNSVIRKITPAGQVSTFAGVAGQPGSVDGTGENARFRSPAAIALGPNDSLFVTDVSDHTIRRISSTGVVSTFAGVPGAFGSGDGPAGVARFNQPYGIAVDTLGQVWVADTGNFTIRRLAGDGTATTVAGQAGVNQIVDGNGTAATLRSPHGVAIEPDGSVLILDYDRLRRMTPAGDVSLVTTELSGTALVVGPGGHVYVTRPPAGTAAQGLADAIAIGIAGPPAGPVILTHPADVSTTTGATATLAVDVTANPLAGYRWQVSTDAGATWTDLASGGGIAGVTTSSLTVAATLARNGHRYRVIVENIIGGATSNAATLTVRGIAVTPAALRFAAWKSSPNSGAPYATTLPQAVNIVVQGAGSPVWTASSNQPWAVVSNGSGTGAGQFTVAIDEPAIRALTGNHSATITIAAPSAALTTTVPIALSIAPINGTNLPAFGVVDTPVQDVGGVVGALSMTGWALDDVGIERIEIQRSCPQFMCGFLAGAPYFIGNATIVPDARPDVEALYSDYPAANKAGWGFMILTNMMPDIPAQTVTGGVGEFTLYAVAHTVTGERRLLGRTLVDQAGTRVTLANDTIAKPFGAIDTPTQGQTVSGTVNNFGWALTPDPGTSVLVPTSGSTINVFIDGASIGTATYNLCRGTVGNPVPAGVLCDDDVSTAFRGNGARFRNLDAARGPIGLRSFDTTTLANGLHTISWGVTDSANRSEGIGSRYFTVLNSAADLATSALRNPETSPANPGTSGPRDPGIPMFARTGFDPLAAYTPLVADASGIPQVRIPELGRVELQIPGVTSGALIVNGESRAVPIGVGIDTERGIVTWAPGVGYLGTYRLAFVVQGSTGSTVHGSTVDVTVAPASTTDEPLRMHLDSPTLGLVLSERSVRVEGWALDPQSASGAGIGAVHVWARKKTSGVFFESDAAKKTPDVFFLGVADINIPRPDVAAAHGAQYPDAGFQLRTSLPAGEWEITAYVWVSRTGRFEDARSASVAIR